MYEIVYTSFINFHIRYKIWNSEYLSYKLPYPVTKYETGYTSFTNFQIQLQSMKQCIRLL